MTDRDEIIALVGRIRASESEGEQDELLEILGQKVIHPTPASVLFLREPPLTDEEAADVLLCYEPISL